MADVYFLFSNIYTPNILCKVRKLLKMFLFCVFQYSCRVQRLTRIFPYNDKIYDFNLKTGKHRTVTSPYADPFYTVVVSGFEFVSVTYPQVLNIKKA